MSDFAFRVAMVVTFIPALGIGVYFRRRSSTGEKLDRRQEGLPILILLRLTGLTLWIAIFWWVFERPSHRLSRRVSLPRGGAEADAINARGK